MSEDLQDYFTIYFTLSIQLFALNIFLLNIKMDIKMDEVLLIETVERYLNGEMTPNEK